MSQECCEELGESQHPREAKVEYGFEEPSVPPRVESGVSSGAPGRKRLSLMMKITIVGVMVAILLCVAVYSMYYA